ncbi:hypothetical protein TNCV_2106591 [Trichonephila clavipes]|nr:hypothetical protein TNCV_2106591 [Trichonephila clavipes]
MGFGWWVSLAAHIMGSTIPDVLHPDTGVIVKVLPVSGQRPMRQLALHVHVMKKLRVLQWRDSSSTPETNESHLVRDQDCMVGVLCAPKPRVLLWFCISVALCGLGLSSNNRVPDLGSPGHFSQIAPFSFDRVSLYRLAMTVRTSKKSSKKTHWASQKTVRSTLPA